MQRPKLDAPIEEEAGLSGTFPRSEASDDDVDDDEEADDPVQPHGEDSGPDPGEEEEVVDEEEEDPAEIRMKVKCGVEVRVLTVMATTSYSHLLKTLTQDYGAIDSMTYEDADGDTVSIRSAHDLTQAFDHYLERLQDRGLPLRLSIVRALPRLPDPGDRAAGRPSLRPPDGASPRNEEDLDVEAPDFKWQKGNLIGKGAVGSVYLGIVHGRGMLLAVKVVELNELEKETPKNAGNLTRELELMKKLKHANIVRYYGCDRDESNNLLNIFLEYVPGGSLASLVKKFGSLPDDTTRHYTRQILAGLQYLHAHGVVHRDIKGDNILVGDDGTVKLADFGSSKELPDLANDSHGCNTMVGTPYWMAPEVITDDAGYGPKADVWSVGCTVVEMMTGNPPWPEFQSMWAAIYHIANSEGPPSEIPADLHHAAQAFLDACFHRDVTRRANCVELLASEFCNPIAVPPYTAS